MALLAFGCSGIERSENDKVRRRNCKGEYIYRNHAEYFCAIAPPAQQTRTPYLWEGNLPRITKEYFRCKGSSANSPIVDASDPEKPVPCPDCEGSTRHGLPVLRSQEGVYPILIDLLNHVQKRTGKRVVITSGHCCPAHNTYCNPSKENKTSKHQIGAEVDFYVQGMEDKPLDLVEILIDYYKENPAYKAQKEYQAFERYEKSDAATRPWLNKEIFIKLNSPSEGRDADNRHPYPYLTLQVRYDRQAKERVIYEWKKANLGYPRG